MCFSYRVIDSKIKIKWYLLPTKKDEDTRKCVCFPLVSFQHVWAFRWQRVMQAERAALAEAKASVDLDQVRADQNLMSVMDESVYDD